MQEGGTKADALEGECARLSRTEEMKEELEERRGEEKRGGEEGQGGLESEDVQATVRALGFLLSSVELSAWSGFHCKWIVLLLAL